MTSIGQLWAGTNDTISKKNQAKPINTGELYVSNTTIYISKASTVTLSGNLILENSMVFGNGRVLLKSNEKQIIHSTLSAISNLEIDNPNSVALIGNLAILENLTIKKGIFDISEGTLILNPENLHLLEGASLFKGKQLEWSTGYPLSSLRSQSQILTGNFADALTTVCSWNFFYKKAPFSFEEMRYRNTTIIPFFKPPREA